MNKILIYFKIVLLMEFNTSIPASLPFVEASMELPVVFLLMSSKSKIFISEINFQLRKLEKVARRKDGWR